MTGASTLEPVNLPGIDEPGEDVGFDRIVQAEDAGVGTGLDEAELARQQKRGGQA